MQTRQALTEAEADELMAEFENLCRQHPEVRRLSFAEQNAVMTKMAAKMFDPPELLIVAC